LPAIGASEPPMSTPRPDSPAGHLDHTLLIVTRKIRFTFHHESRGFESPRFLLLPVVIRQNYTPDNLATNSIRPYHPDSPVPHIYVDERRKNKMFGIRQRQGRKQLGAVLLFPNFLSRAWISSRTNNAPVSSVPFKP